MNYYIDFDNTLYNTQLLKNKILDSMVKLIIEKNNLDYDSVYKECEDKFHRKYVSNVHELANHFANKYNLELSVVINNLNTVILNREDLVFNDCIPFLKKLKANGHKVYLLSFCKYGPEFQTIKIAGSKLTVFFDGLYITCIPKYNLEIDYTNGIFIDDNPNDLLGLYSKNPKQVIRLRRKGTTHSKKNIHNENIKEYSTFNEIYVA